MGGNTFTVAAMRAAEVPHDPRHQIVGRDDFERRAAVLVAVSRRGHDELRGEESFVVVGSDRLPEVTKLIGREQHELLSFTKETSPKSPKLREGHRVLHLLGAAVVGVVVLGMVLKSIPLHTRDVQAIQRAYDARRRLDTSRRDASSPSSARCSCASTGAETRCSSTSRTLCAARTASTTSRRRPEQDGRAPQGACPYPCLRRDAPPDAARPRGAPDKFTIPTWNLQADRARGPNHDGTDRRGAERCVRSLLTGLQVPRLRGRPLFEM